MKLIVLDRDGVINRDSDNFIKSPEEWIAISGSLEAIAKLNRAGYIVVVATNQSGIARGYFDTAVLSKIHKKMQNHLSQYNGHVDAVFFCPHGPDDDCECRKPKPGMLWEISDRFQVRMENVYVIGDSIRDLQSADAVGAKPVLVRTGKGEKSVKQLKENGFSDVPVFKNLAEAVDGLELI